ncbi:hypothetical protein IV203_008334 [Nitzschia inconspicua]|uniref:Uncharacterized protein n=1 Tax=Nitzschia inconspicua TaxID=303405 RepID=A0A9K3PML1_9STRA|nr:hypothetical protein IV203_008334 [Nitzschia inconspicua]
MAALVEIATFVGMIDSAAEFSLGHRSKSLCYLVSSAAAFDRNTIVLSSPARSSPSRRTSNANFHVPYPTVLNNTGVEKSLSLSGATGSLSKLAVPASTP